MLGFKRFCGINRKSFHLVRMTALQSALQVYSKIVVGCRNVFHLICIYTVPVFRLICISFDLYFMYLLHLITWHHN